MTDKVALKPITLLGRQIVFNTPNTAQLAILRRVGIIAGAAGTQLDTMGEDDPGRGAVLERGLDAAGRGLDLIEGMVADDEDRQWLMDQMVAGRLDIDDVFDAMRQLDPDTPEKKAPAKKAARRG